MVVNGSVALNHHNNGSLCNLTLERNCEVT